MSIEVKLRDFLNIINYVDLYESVVTLQKYRFIDDIVIEFSSDTIKLKDKTTKIEEFIDDFSIHFEENLDLALERLVGKSLKSYMQQTLKSPICDRIVLNGIEYVRKR